MSENNFAITEPVKEEETEDEYKPLSSGRFVRQKAGLRMVKQRKRKERQAMNKMLHAPRRAKKVMKKMGISDKIQHGYNIVEKWKDDNDKIVEEKE